MTTGPKLASAAMPVVLNREAQGAFSRLRVAHPLTLFDCKLLVDAAPLFWDDQQTAGSGTTSTYNQNQASVTLTVSANTAGTRARQTFRRFNYQPGKGQVIIMTGILAPGGAATGITRRKGYYDSRNGIFLQLAGSTLSFVVRSFTSGVAVDTVVPQSSWNIDRLDGTKSALNPSGVTLDVTKTQILIADFQWLGVGSIRFGFDIGGAIVYCHQIDNANLNTLVYMSTPNLPLRHEISNDGTGPSATTTCICSAVISDGGREFSGIVRAAPRTTELTTLSNTAFYPLVAMRLSGSYAPQQADIRVTSSEVTCTSTAAFVWQLVLNPTIVGTAFTYVDVPNSAIQVVTGTTNATTITGGVVVAAGTGKSSTNTASTATAQIESDLQIGANIAGTSDVLVLAAARITGTAETFLGTLSWREEL